MFIKAAREIYSDVKWYGNDWLGSQASSSSAFKNKQISVIRNRQFVKKKTKILKYVPYAAWTLRLT